MTMNKLKTFCGNFPSQMSHPYFESIANVGLYKILTKENAKLSYHMNVFSRIYIYIYIYII